MVTPLVVWWSWDHPDGGHLGCLDPPVERVSCDPQKGVTIMIMAIIRIPLLVGTKRKPLF